MTPGGPSVSVVVCAYTDRRWDDIVRAVASVAAQNRHAEELLLVIDHNEALAERAAAELPGVKVMTNAHARGLSGARNTGVEVAAGEVIAFLDDDAAARPDWLERLLAPYADSSVAAVGGAAFPLWPATAGRPAVLPARDVSAAGELDWVVGCSYTGQPTGLAEVRNLMGCNMSFRRDVFAQVGGFSDGLGRIGSTPLGCEETELCIRLRQRMPEARIVFEPAARVTHRVGEARWPARWRSWQPCSSPRPGTCADFGAGGRRSPTQARSRWPNWTCRIARTSCGWAEPAAGSTVARRCCCGPAAAPSRWPGCPFATEWWT